MRYADASLDSVISELRYDGNQSASNQQSLIVDELIFKECLTFKNLSFLHKGSDQWTLKELNFSLKKGNCLGIAGSTGAGKSTLIDIVSGLLKPSTGRLFI